MQSDGFWNLIYHNHTAAPAGKAGEKGGQMTKEQRKESGISKFAGNAKEVLKLDKEGNVVEHFASIKMAAEAEGVDQITIRRWVMDGNLHHGYAYQYAEKERKEFRIPLREKRGEESFRRRPYMGIYSKAEK